MKTSLSKSTNLQGFPAYTGSRKQRNSSKHKRDPYLDVKAFYENVNNRFWEDEHHTEASKEYFRSTFNIVS